MATETTRKLPVESYDDKEKEKETKKAEPPNQLVLLKRIDRLVEQLDAAGLAYLRTKLAQAKEG